MALGDNWFDCSDAKAISLEDAVRKMIYDDGSGNPVWTTNTSTTLTNWFDCSDSRKNVSTEQVLKLMIIEDANGDPQWNVSTL